MTKSILIIHPGMHKTGTTALQRGLYHCHKVLLRNKIYYPIHLSSKYAHHALFGWKIGQKKSYPLQPSFQEEWAQIAQCAKKNGSKFTVLSSESLWRALEVNLRRMHEFTGHFNQIKIVANLRHQTDFIQAFYSERLKTIQYSTLPSFISAVETATQDISKIHHYPLYYSQRIKLFEKLFPDAEIVVADYQTAVESGLGVVRCFFEQANLPVPFNIKKHNPNPIANKSLSPLEIIIAQRLGLQITSGVRKVIQQEVRKMLPNADRSTIFTRSEFIILNEHFNKLNIKCRDELGEGRYPLLRSQYENNPPQFYRDDLSENDWEDLTNHVTKALNEKQSQ